MFLPNYQDSSIVNLMSSILKAFGGKSVYNPLKLLDPEELEKSSNIVLLVIDGLGYDYLAKKGKGSAFWKNLKGEITSVFPSTTAACVTTFATGVAPQQHAITGWFTYLKELGNVTTILPFTPRTGGLPYSWLGINPKGIFDQEPVYNRLKAKSYIVIGQGLVSSDFTLTTAGKSFLVPYNSLTDCFKQIEKIILSGKSRKFIYGYWPDFDMLCHKHGTEGKQVSKHFQDLDKKTRAFLEAIEGSNTTVIVTADHGLIDTEKSRVIDLRDYPDLVDTLILPLCGEPRVAYCYVRSSKAKQFENYVKENFSDKCNLFRSEDLVKKGFFGLFEPNKKLFERIGDYILVMKENYIIKDYVPGEDPGFNIGNHGGVSREEMIVPLIMVNL